ncbi:MAG: hypothetical protein AAGJ35_02770, partial [Myxococcota bacterium]
KNDLEFAMQAVQRTVQNAGTAFSLWKCGFTDCPSAAVAFGFFAGLSVISEATMTALYLDTKSAQEEIKEQDQKFEQKQMTIECDADGTARVDSEIRIEQLKQQLLVIGLDILQTRYDVALGLSQIKGVQDRVKRLIAQQEQVTQQVINIQAARNDPNIRIYQNDAIIAAERTFNQAMSAAYEATVVYEYYTGTSYRDKNKLFLTRMISAGDNTLEAYISDLEIAFRDFEKSNGKPDIRVMILSLKDDILNVPTSLESGEPLTTIQREARLQKMLNDPQRVNAEGFIAFPFPLSVLRDDSRVSPLTNNHKILYIEAEIIGGDLGDGVGRLYLRQKGTGVVRIPGDLSYYALPQRTAVINPFFNATKDLDRSIYQNFRLRDRPLGNTHWELLLNQFSEKENQDINLNSINDIKLYIYYNDFTQE